MRDLRQYWDLLRHMGVGWLAYRGLYALKRRSGSLCRATPVGAWTELPVPGLRLRANNGVRGIPPSWGDACIGEAGKALKGEFRLFSDQWVQAGYPPDWHRNQLSGEQVLAERHWTKLGDFDFGDIKGVWELNRFPWAFALARAFARTQAVRYADGFWSLFGDWCERNSPNRGPNWMCGQEATFRLIAATFAVEAIGLPEEHRQCFSRFVVATGRRIAANLGYALSQKNNHGISECVGLVTAALLLPEHGETGRWLERGMGGLKGQLAELVYEDGGFSQHSLIYHRVLLHDLCWIRYRMKTAGEPVPEWLDEAGRRALDFAVTLTEPATGLAPLYGANDGANVLPLAEAEFLDFRPTLQLGAALFRGELLLPEGPWDEAVAWLVPQWQKLKRAGWPQPVSHWHARASGCFQLRHGSGRLFLRCPESYRHRPGHADMLHVDIWHDGKPVVTDGGSFSYNSSQRFTALRQAAHHNVLTVDGGEPMEKFSRFLYLPWPHGQAGEDKNSVFSASHDGYSRLGVAWTRDVAVRPTGGFVVHDRVTGAKGHRLTWHWRLTEAPWRLTRGGEGLEVRDERWNYRLRWRCPAHSPLQAQLVRADPTTADGWWAPHYGSVEPAWTLRLETNAVTDIELTTEFLRGD